MPHQEEDAPMFLAPLPSDQEGVGAMNWDGWKRRNLDENGELYQDWPKEESL